MPGINYEDYYKQKPQYPTSSMNFDVLGEKLSTVSPLWGIGSQLGSGLLSLLGGKSQRETDRRRVFKFLESLKGRPAIDPRSTQQFIPQIEKSLIPFAP